MKPKTLLIVGVAALVVLVGGLSLWARSVLASDAVRTAVAGQLSEALGQPVAIGGIGASVLPRVTMTLHDVEIGSPAEVRVARLHVGTAFGALLSRRIEHADLILEEARLNLPLSLSAPTAEAGGEVDDGSALVQLVSVDQISLSDVEIVSGGRTLRGDAELVWDRGTLAVQEAQLGADDAMVTIAGQITDVSGPRGTLAVTSEDLGLLDLVEFFSDFSAGAIAGAPAESSAAVARSSSSASAMDLTLDLEAPGATLGTMSLDALSGQARVTADGLSLSPVGFGVFGGRAEGALTFSLDETPTFELTASLTNVDVGAAMAFVGSPDTVTGQASGRLEMTGRGTTAGELVDSIQGEARLSIADGAVSGLGLVRNLVLATSGRADSQTEALTTRPDGSFDRLELTAAISGGALTTRDLQFASPDVTMAAIGAIDLATTTVDMVADVQLSEDLSSGAGRDLVRYTAQDGRVTLPATVTGPLDGLVVRPDLADAARRALVNRATDEARKAISSGLRRIIRRDR